MLTPEFFSCDWGTTSFRLRRVRRSDLAIIAELREPAGVKVIYECAPAQKERAKRFAEFLTEALAKIQPPSRGTAADPLVLVISGMASSSIGWKELPYAKAPFRLSGAGLAFEKLSWAQPDTISTTYMISGVAHDTDVMRGEETEIIGLMAHPALAALRKSCVVLLPGTHSKHVAIEKQRVVDFQTHMTGELFEVLSNHSVLRASVCRGTMPDFDATARAAFRAGAVYSRDHGISMSLFRVRTRAVLDGSPALENTWFLSGVLIGAEIFSLLERAESTPIVLAASSRFAAPYALAMETLAGSAAYSGWTQIEPDEVERAAVMAHGLFLEQHEE